MKHFIKRPFLSVAKHLSLWHQVVHQRSLLEMARQRVFIAGSLVAVAYLLICGRLVDVMVLRSSKNVSHAVSEQIATLPRADIVDRNGEILATHLVTASIYANPKVILNAKEAAEKLAKVLPEVGFEVLYQRLSSAKGFVWLARHLPPKLQQAINQMGIPGVYLHKDHRRVYPYGRLASHALGYCGVDNNGLAGVEKFFDSQLLKSPEPLKLSLDIRVQHIVHDEMTKGISEFSAVGGNAMVMDIQTGELIAMVSFPGFDPNQPAQGPQEATFNRNTLGVYEPGSTFKILNTAIALESGSATLNSRYDASRPISIGRFTITDFRGLNRVVTLAEAFVHSSNIAAIKISQEFGIATQKAYLKKFGVFNTASLEIPEIGHPLIPTTWKEPTSMTVSYGYGISVTPLRLITTIGGVINSGVLPQATLLHKNDKAREATIRANKEKGQIISEKTSGIIRDLMRTAVKIGTSKKANIPGYDVMGKTGTAYKIQGKGYATGKARTTFFIGSFPHSSPRYIMLIMLDDPKPTKSTYGFATGGWNSTLIAGKIIERMGPILGVHVNASDAENEDGGQLPKGWVNVSHITPMRESVDESR
ncbi:MAG: penicillin-binding protein 2 [Alphaproteobacteria bacterium]|nr:penicillin-binding protein 2 [Alphaproteobacteria bacterium]